ncbi:hypothetical protein BJ742DRAFT_92455 [Cladochytrium replicatum]|nr:hypothetical protein BJ742DRAFT_92455 [Cladochytrium replicatum]
MNPPIRIVALVEEVDLEKQEKQRTLDFVPKTLLEKFLKLYSIFIEKNYPLELNISSVTRDQNVETIETFNESQLRCRHSSCGHKSKATITRWLKIIGRNSADDEAPNRPEDILPLRTCLPLNAKHNASTSAPSSLLSIRSPPIIGVQHSPAKESPIDSASLNPAVTGSTTTISRKSGDFGQLHMTLFDKALDEVLDLLFYNIFPHWILSHAGMENGDEK